jgi:hypothetical protein
VRLAFERIIHDFRKGIETAFPHPPNQFELFLRLAIGPVEYPPYQRRFL